MLGCNLDSTFLNCAVSNYSFPAFVLLLVVLLSVALATAYYITPLVTAGFRWTTDHLTRLLYPSKTEL